MLEQIKSSFITKEIFAYISNERKLELIKYNKHMQKILDVNLLNYKIYSGKYLLIDKNGIGKEFDYEGNLIFEGQYLKGKKMEKEKNIFVIP